MKRYYLAYGSNLNIPQMMRRCPNARIIGTAEIPDYRLFFKGSKTGSYLTIEAAEGFTVPVGVWEVSPEDEARLDVYEGYPSFYYKAETELPVRGIRTGKVRIRRAFVYIMHEERDIGIPSPFYIERCREGYEAFGFDPRHLDEALMYSVEKWKQQVRGTQVKATQVKATQPGKATQQVKATQVKAAQQVKATQQGRRGAREKR